MPNLLNLTNKVKTIIIFSLLGVLSIVFSWSVWLKLESVTLQDELDIATSKVTMLESDKDKAVRASDSCKRTLKRLIADNKKKHKVIKLFKEKIGGQIDEVSDLDEFINYANRLQ